MTDVISTTYKVLLVDVCGRVCLFVYVFGIGSKTTEPIELKFTHNLCGDPVKVIG